VGVSVSPDSRQALHQAILAAREVRFVGTAFNFGLEHESASPYLAAECATLGDGPGRGGNLVFLPDASECQPGIDSRWRESVNMRGAAQGRAVGGAPANIAD
jgi:hypothetical protein